MQSSSHTIIFIALVIVSVVVLSVDGRLKTKFSQSPELFKSRQGPPSEFGQRQLPKPSQVTQSSDSALIPITLEKQGEQFVWKGQLPFDATQVTISLLSTEAKHMTLTVVDAQKSAEVVDQWIGYNENHGVPAKTYKFDEFKAGMRDLEISCPADLPTLANSDAHVLKLLVFNASPIRVYSHLITYDLSLNREIGVRASLGESKLNRTGVSSHIPSPIRIEDLPNPNGNNAFVVDMDVILPDGQEQVIHMKDDGESADENARDGIWGAKIQATEVGDYVVQVVMKARIDTNKPGANTNQEPLYLYRTSQHVLSVVEDALDLLPKATVDVDANDEMIEIVMHAKPETDVAGKKFSAYAEVWGTSSDKKLVPVAWISGMTIAQKQGETVGLKLKLNARWLARAKASFPLKLKNAYVLDVDTAVPLSTISEIDVDHQAGDIKRLMAAHSIYSFDGTITEEMTMGKRPKLLTATTGAAASGHKVILVHGYCSNNNPFSTSDFTNFVEFLDAKQSRSNDEFALLIQQLAANYESVSIVGHSQGGLAALHLLENYWSHLDNAKSTNDYRVIQSVGSPYRGSGLAGTLASIGSVFGVGCGANTDLTHDGAERWLATISAESKKNVYYYTSQYKPYSYCNLAANAVLSWPNDGTTELDYANLDGANKQAHLQGYCHTADMKYPPQCQNHDQNQEINSFAHP